MNILFVHQNMPGQFANLAAHLAARPGNRVVFLTKRFDVDMLGVERVNYSLPREKVMTAHLYARSFDNAVRHGRQVADTCERLKRDGFVPDVMIAHPGWGEALFLKDIFPRTPLINYCEFYYDGHGADINFDPADPPSIERMLMVRAADAHLLLSLESCDAGISPSEWQKSQHPAALRSKIRVIPDGVDIENVRPNRTARADLPSGITLTAAHEIVTFVARNLEPYRGFDMFMRALPQVLEARPHAQVVVIGGDGLSYGRAAPDGLTWREHMMKEVGLDPARVHFPGQVPYPLYLSLLQISSAHVYLTRPFVLSWSCLEAMAVGCLMVASSTPPVTELIKDGVNGLLVDFHSPDQIAARVVDALSRPEAFEELRASARRTIERRASFDASIASQLQLISEVTGMAASAGSA